MKILGEPQAERQKQRGRQSAAVVTLGNTFLARQQFLVLLSVMANPFAVLGESFRIQVHRVQLQPLQQPQNGDVLKWGSPNSWQIPVGVPLKQSQNGYPQKTHTHVLSVHACFCALHRRAAGIHGIRKGAQSSCLRKSPFAVDVATKMCHGSLDHRLLKCSAWH